MIFAVHLHSAAAVVVVVDMARKKLMFLSTAERKCEIHVPK